MTVRGLKPRLASWARPPAMLARTGVAGRKRRTSRPKALKSRTTRCLMLNTVCNRGLHAVEEKEAAEKDESDGGGGSEKEEAGSVAAAGDGPAETVNHASHGVEAVKPAPALGDQRGWIGDGRGEHPELDEEGDDVADVAIERVERGKPEADAESGEEREGQQRGEPERGERGANAVGESEDGEDHEADGEVHQAGERGGNGENQAREIHFGDEALVFDDDVGGHLEGVGEVGPGNESGEIKNGIGKAVGGQLGETAEEESEDEHVEKRLENDPEDADGGLFVADLDVAPDEEIKEFAVGPDFAEAKLEKAAGRLDADGGGTEREGGVGWRGGGHAVRAKAPSEMEKPLIRVSEMERRRIREARDFFRAA